MDLRHLALDEDPALDREVLHNVLGLEQGASVVRAHAVSASSGLIVASRLVRLSSTERWQASRCPSPTFAVSFGSSDRQRSKACGHRGRKLHPLGRLISDGGWPAISGSLRAFGRARRAVGSRRPPVVGGWWTL